MPSRYRMALITGATSGIGAAFSAALPPETGLLLTGRDPDRLAAEADLHRREGRRIETVAADLATEQGREAVIAAARALHVDLLVNNAGFGKFGPSLENGREVELDMVAVNVTAVVDLIHALLPLYLVTVLGASALTVGIIEGVAEDRPAICKSPAQIPAAGLNPQVEVSM